MKILSIFGTRPEAIKMAPVVKELEKYPDQIESKVCVTAQHREMLDQVLDLFDIHPNYDLDLMRDNQTPTQVASHVLRRVETVLEIEKPDWVLVQGDTTTVAAAAWAAFNAGVQVGHVEAGLRTFNRRNPFPEEINRRIAGVLADLHFAPTHNAKSNLIKEGIPPEDIFVTGNPVIDALQWVMKLPYEMGDGLLRDIPWEKRILLVTAHRRENHGDPLESIFQGLRDLALDRSDEIYIVYPVHPNPNVKEPAERILSDIENISLMSPLGYLDLVQLMNRAYFVLTDSGGLQEEAPGLGKPVLVLRETTERPEAVDAGTVRLVGTGRERIVKEARRLLDEPDAYSQMANAVNPYGDGFAEGRIVSLLKGEKISGFQS